VASWRDVETDAPDLAASARRLFDAHRHKTIATLRKDGSPRISGTETQFRDGELWIGIMFGARKAADLQRDPRFALHSGSDDPPEPAAGDASGTPDDAARAVAAAWAGDAKVAGRMVEIHDEALIEAINGPGPGPSHLFRADIGEVAVVRLNAAGDKLVVQSWHPGRGVETVER